MPIDANGTATTPDGILKYNTSADAPSGKGLNNVVDSIQAALTASYLRKPWTPNDGDVPVWDAASSTWKRSSTDSKRPAPAGLGSGTPDNTKMLRGDSTWNQVADAQVAAAAAIQRSKLERNLTSVSLNVAQSIPNGALTVINWDTETVDDQNQHGAGSGSITLARTGVYVISLAVAWANVAAGDRGAWISVGGSTVAGSVYTRDGIFGNAHSNASIVWSGTVGDIIQAQVVQNQGGAINTAGGNTCRMSVFQL